MRVVIAAIATLFLAGASPREACPLGGLQMASPNLRQQNTWHQLSVNAELLSPSAMAVSSARHRSVLPPAAGSFIDTDVFAKMSQDRIVPAGRSSDAEFLRRVTLDLVAQCLFRSRGTQAGRCGRRRQTNSPARGRLAALHPAH